MEQNRKTCPPVKKYTISKESHQNIRQQLPWHCFVYFKLVKWFLLSPKNSIYVQYSISVEMSMKVLYTIKTTNKRANERANE